MVSVVDSDKCVGNYISRNTADRLLIDIDLLKLQNNAHYNACYECVTVQGGVLSKDNTTNTFV